MTQFSDNNIPRPFLNHLGMYEISGRLFPKYLSRVQQKRRVEYARYLLSFIEKRINERRRKGELPPFLPQKFRVCQSIKKPIGMILRDREILLHKLRESIQKSRKIIERHVIVAQAAILNYRFQQTVQIGLPVNNIC